jgi:Mn-dependent DtxR family transcriptional regulator
MMHLIGSDWYYKAVKILKSLEVARTAQVAILLRIKTPQALRLLKQMEVAGVVEKDKSSCSNCFSWKLTKEKSQC